MNLYRKLNNDICAVRSRLQVSGALPQELIIDKVEVLPPREEGLGDMASSIAMWVAALIANITHCFAWDEYRCAFGMHAYNWLGK